MHVSAGWSYYSDDGYSSFLNHWGHICISLSVVIYPQASFASIKTILYGLEAECSLRVKS